MDGLLLVLKESFVTSVTVGALRRSLDGDSAAFFLGAAQAITGSSPIWNTGDSVLRDRGLFQGHRQEAREIDKQLALAAEHLNAIVLSHAHIDHSGNLPLLVKQRNRGPVYDAFDNRMCETMLKDSAHIKESDAEFVKRRAHRRRSIGEPANGDPAAPLYTQEDAARRWSSSSQRRCILRSCWRDRLGCDGWKYSLAVFEMSSD
jgi:glyoxylase-like metal-dependent hydrolase (beta-lactamase superfamily II)